MEKPAFLLDALSHPQRLLYVPAPEASYDWIYIRTLLDTRSHAGSSNHDVIALDADLVQRGQSVILENTPMKRTWGLRCFQPRRQANASPRFSKGW